MDDEGVMGPRGTSGSDADWSEALAYGAGGEDRSFGARSESAPAGRVTLHEARGAHEVWSLAASGGLTVTQLTPAPCRASLLRAVLGDMGFEAGAVEGDVRVRGPLAGKAFSLVAVLEQDGAAIQWGRRVEAGDVLAVPPGGELDGRFQGRTAYAVVSAPWSQVMQRAEAFEWLAEPRFWAEPALHAPPPEARAACRRVLHGAASLLRAMGGEIPSSALAFLRQELLDGVLTALAASQGQRPEAEGSRRQGPVNATRIVRQVEDFVESGVRHPIQVDDICEALKLSRRTLYRAFGDLLDVSPKAYLRLKSLSAARARLLDADDPPATVTEVALDNGFWELGRFSGAYRGMFGESPSETLRAAALVQGERNLRR